MYNKCVVRVSSWDQVTEYLCQKEPQQSGVTD